MWTNSCGSNVTWCVQKSKCLPRLAAAGLGVEAGATSKRTLASRLMNWDQNHRQVLEIVSRIIVDFCILQRSL